MGLKSLVTVNFHIPTYLTLELISLRFRRLDSSPFSAFYYLYDLEKEDSNPLQRETEPGQLSSSCSPIPMLCLNGHTSSWVPISKLFKLPVLSLIRCKVGLCFC